MNDPTILNDILAERAKGAQAMKRLICRDLIRWVESIRIDDGERRPDAAQTILDMLTLRLRTIPSSWALAAADDDPQGTLEDAEKEQRRLQTIEIAARDVDRVERVHDPSGRGVVARAAAWRRLQDALGNPFHNL